ncbi:MAG: hypothetical protein K2M44_06000 [Clostridia bacterium]|nr:hypothetical protein [Clostridia bacterium]
MFDWINFTPQRFLRPAVLTGLVLTVVFLLVALLAGIADETVNERRVKKGKDKIGVAIVMRGIGLAGIIAGVLTVLLSI